MKVWVVTEVDGYDEIVVAVAATLEDARIFVEIDTRKETRCVDEAPLSRHRIEILRGRTKKKFHPYGYVTEFEVVEEVK